jgi:predicted CoA-binding protein
MSSVREEFWTNSSFAFVGHSAEKGFPTLSYGELKKQGKKVFAVDPSVGEIAGDKTYPDLAST